MTSHCTYVRHCSLRYNTHNTHDISGDGSFAIFRQLVVILTGLLFIVLVNTVTAARIELRIMCILNHIQV
jgi:hypothetical protein